MGEHTEEYREAIESNKKYHAMRAARAETGYPLQGMAANPLKRERNPECIDNRLEKLEADAESALLKAQRLLFSLEGRPNDVCPALTGTSSVIAVNVRVEHLISVVARINQALDDANVAVSG